MAAHHRLGCNLGVCPSARERWRWDGEEVKVNEKVLQAFRVVASRRRVGILTGTLTNINLFRGVLHDIGVSRM